MDYKNLTAPCGRDCFNCPFYLARNNEKFRMVFAEKMKLDPKEISCEGCRNIEGKCQVLKNYGFDGNCKIYNCFKDKGIEFCYECNDFPCNLLHPLADRSDKFPHNLKVYNLCKIQKVGLELWAKNYAKQSFDRYYSGKLNDCVG
jgi:hypothetical protein